MPAFQWLLVARERLEDGSKIKPIPIQGDAKENRSASTREVRTSKGLLGALQWLATQAAPHLSCSFHATRHRDASEQTIEVCNEPQRRRADVSTQTRLLLVRPSLLGNNQGGDFGRIECCVCFYQWFFSKRNAHDEDRAQKDKIIDLDTHLNPRTWHLHAKWCQRYLRNGVTVEGVHETFRTPLWQHHNNGRRARYLGRTDGPDDVLQARQIHTCGDMTSL